MKKLIFSALFAGMTLLANAQSVLDKAQQDLIKGPKEKSDKDITNPKNAIKAKTWLTRAQAYEDVAAQMLSLDSNAAVVAYEAYKKAIELDTKDGKPGSTAKEAKTAMSGNKLFQAFMQQGAGYYQNKNYSKSHQAFNIATEINPKDTVSTLYSGVAAQLGKDYPNAIVAYEKHVALGGKDPIVYYSLYSMYKDLKQDDKAMVALDKGIAVNPDNKDLKAEKTNYYITSGKTEEAISSLKEMVAKDPSNASNILNVGVLYDNLYTDNVKEIRKLSESMGHSSDSQAKIDSKTTQVQAYKEERDRLAAQLKKNPKLADVKRRLGEAETFLKEQQAVLENLKAEKAAEDLKAKDNAGIQAKIDELATKRDGNKNNALEWYNKALAVDQFNFDALYNKGVMIFNEAVELKKPYDNLNPSSTEFKSKGKEMEDAFMNKFKEVVPIFEKAYGQKKDEILIENMKNLYRILKMEDKLKGLGE